MIGMNAMSIWFYSNSKQELDREDYLSNKLIK